MIVTIKNIAKCLLSPRLYNTHRHGRMDNFYQPRFTEAYGDTVIKAACMFRDLSFYMSPFILMYLYRRGVTYEDLHQFSYMFGGLSCILVIAFLSRAWGRATNPEYMKFIQALNTPKNDIPSYLEEIRKYDFEFNAWPATYNMQYYTDNSIVAQKNTFVAKENQHLHLYQKYIVKFLAYIAVNTFALRLIYPGTLGLIHYLLRIPLLQGRASLIEEHHGKRVKIVAKDGNSIDTMFIDNRSVLDYNTGSKRATTKGSTLVICSEGNSGFYEVGIMMTPLKAGYSVLGWNHPGFAGSTGLPYPSQELAAIDAVMQYALQELKFHRDQIVLYGWSIGGYSAAWAAATFNVRALVLDATFDDLLPLAVKQMPASWEPLVREVVRSHVDLHVADQLRDCRSSLHLIRRTEDEIICLSPGDIRTNRGNNLLVELIKYRHSEEELFNEAELVSYANMAASDRPNYKAHGLDTTSKYILGLIAKYSSDFESTHCVPLPTAKFESVMRSLLQID